MKQMEFHMKKGGKWVPFSMDSASGKPTRKELWLGMDGKDIVVKMTVDDVVCYIAGTEELVAHYKGKGHKAISFTQAVTQMEKANTPYFDQDLVDAYAAMVRVFPGTSLSKIEDTRGE